MKRNRTTQRAEEDETLSFAGRMEGSGVLEDEKTSFCSYLGKCFLFFLFVGPTVWLDGCSKGIVCLQRYSAAQMPNRIVATRPRRENTTI